MRTGTCRAAILLVAVAALTAAGCGGATDADRLPVRPGDSKTMTRLYSRDGNRVGWISTDPGSRPAVILDLGGEPVAFIRGDQVFSFDGSYRAVWEKGWLRDKEGEAVAFIPGAIGGPITPILAVEITPTEPVPLIPPIPATSHIGITPIASLSWSDLSFEEMFSLDRNDS